MALEQRIIEYGGWRLVVSKATVKIGLRRLELSERGRMHLAENPSNDPMEVYARTVDYPAMAAALVSAMRPSGDEIEMPITFDAFMNEVPEQLWNKWGEAVRALNPHWFGDDEGDAPKDAPPPSA